MSITPPDPGNALQLAKDYNYSATSAGFVRTTDSEVRWLYPEAGRWIAFASAERRFSQATYDKLRAGFQTDRQKGTAFFTSGSQTYVLLDNGFEAVAEAA